MTPPPRGSTAARQRKLHAGHFAFMRAVVQGLDPRESWERYFRVDGEVADPPMVRATIAWIRDEFAAAAKREFRPGTARLVRIDAARLSAPAAVLPSLEHFAEEHGLADESQAQQLAAYEAAHGRATQQLGRRARLVARQLDALRWLEGLVAQAPAPGDAVAAWLNPTLAAHLEAAGLRTLGQLAERINGIGHRWFAGLRPLGEVKARRIVEWLQEVATADPALHIGEHVALPRHRLYTHELAAVVAPATDVRPLEKFTVPAALDGSRGLFRRPAAQCRVKAANDLEAILAWLRAKRGLGDAEKAQRQARRRQRHTGVEHGLDWLQSLSNTQRAYRKEAERFLLWAVLQKGKALSSTTPADCAEYLDFLVDPQPRARWCGTRARERWSPLWRPFEGPLSASARRHAATVLKNLGGFLVDEGYLMGNPWSAVGAPAERDPVPDANRSFSLAQWHDIQAQLARRPDTSVNRRLAFALRLLYSTGLRLSEVVAATAGDLQWTDEPPVAPGEPALQGWLLRVAGPRGRAREVPVPDEVVAELGDYLASRGLNPDPRAAGQAATFLLGRASDAAERAPHLRAGRAFEPRQGIATTTLHDQIKAFFLDCALALREHGDEAGAARFAHASAHWLRHSHARHAIAGGLPVEVAQHQLGHASLATTQAYVATDRARRLRATQAYWKR